MLQFSKVLSFAVLVLLALMLVPLLAFSQSEPHGTPTRIYVDQAAVGADNGTSWTNAYTSLQDALAEARTLVPGNSVEIWVARGVYYPDIGAGLAANDRGLAFELVSTVAIYGGFAGGESALDQRDWLANRTILSGDIDGNDIVDGDGLTVSHTGVVGANSYHVVRASDAAPGTVLDGVSITGGQANGLGAINGVFLMRHGAGLYSRNSSLTLGNVRFQGNLAPNTPNGAHGGGAYFFSEGGRSDLATLSRVEVINNRAEFGGGLHAFRTALRITDSLVRGNQADTGAGLFMNIVSVDILNSRIEANSAINGGGLFGFRDFLTLVNSELRGNFATGNGGGYLANSSTSVSVPQLLTNVTVSGNRAGGIGGGIHRAQEAVGESVLFNTIFWNNQDSTGVGTASASHGGPGAARIDASHSLLQGLNPAGPNNLDGTLAANNPQFITPINPALAPTSAGNLRVGPGAPTIDRGDNMARINPLAGSPPPIPLAGNLLFDLDGLERINDGSGNGIATVDLGPYERDAAVRPIADAGPDRNLTSGVLVVLNGNGSTSPVGALPLSYAWTQLSGEAVILINSGTVAPFFMTPFVNDDLVFELVVTDNLGAISEPDTVTITVSLPEYQVNASPVGQGSVTPASQVVIWDQTANLTVVPDPGWSTDGLVGDTCMPALVAGNQWQAANIQTDCAIEAVFTVNSYPISGTVSGLAGSGLQLDLNGIEQLPVASDGSFQFLTEVDHASNYAVSVSTQPSAPSQACTVPNGSGTVNAAAVTDIIVTCSINQFTVGGTLTGLVSGSSLILQNNGGDDLAITTDGGFTFATALADLSNYSVTVATQPEGPIQTCVVANGSGTLAGSNVDDVAVQCSSEPASLLLDVQDLDFGVWTSGDQDTRIVTLTNAGTGELQISQISAPDAPFELVGGTCLPVPTELLPGASCAIEIAFAPPLGGSGQFESSVNIVSNAPSSPDEITLRGTAITPIAVPMLGPFGLALLALMLGALAFRQRAGQTA